jgi:hypothetical protein
MPILQNLNQVTVRVINHPGQHITKKRRPQQKHVKRIDVPEETKKKKKSIKYKIEPKSIKQIKQIKDYDTSPYAKANLQCVGSRFTSCGREFNALQPKTTND